MQATDFATLRDLILFYAGQRGWSTQRHVAVICGLDESALSRFLNGEQDIGARRTHTLFQAVGVPVPGGHGVATGAGASRTTSIDPVSSPATL